MKSKILKKVRIMTTARAFALLTTLMVITSMSSVGWAKKKAKVMGISPSSSHTESGAKIPVSILKPLERLFSESTGMPVGSFELRFDPNKRHLNQIFFIGGFHSAPIFFNFLVEFSQLERLRKVLAGSASSTTIEAIHSNCCFNSSTRARCDRTSPSKIS
jgi:hypothetical protein